MLIKINANQLQRQINLLIVRLRFTSAHNSSCVLCLDIFMCHWVFLLKLKCTQVFRMTLLCRSCLCGIFLTEWLYCYVFAHHVPYFTFNFNRFFQLFYSVRTDKLVAQNSWLNILSNDCLGHWDLVCNERWRVIIIKNMTQIHLIYSSISQIKSARKWAILHMDE